MTQSNLIFQKALKFVLDAEGGYSNDPADHGGVTNFGITQAVYTEWLSKKKLQPASVKNITRSIVEQIYFDNYWQPCKCSELPEPLSIVVFDTAVNMGVGQASKFLQKQLNETLNIALKIDGIIGAMTVAEAKRVINLTFFIALYLNKRVAFYDEIVDHNPSQRKFINGWYNRITKLKKYIAN